MSAELRTVRLPASVVHSVESLTAGEEFGVDGFVASAVREKLAAVLADGYLERRAARGSRAAFDEALASVPDVPPVPGDEIEDGS